MLSGSPRSLLGEMRGGRGDVIMRTPAHPLDRHHGDLSRSARPRRSSRLVAMVTSLCLALASGPPNGSYTLTFQALPDQATYPDGATVTNTNWSEGWGRNATAVGAQAPSPTARGVQRCRREPGRAAQRCRATGRWALRRTPPRLVNTPVRQKLITNCCVRVTQQIYLRRIAGAPPAERLSTDGG